MHEQSLVRTLLKLVDQIRLQNNGGQVTQVRVQLGPLSGVEPLLLSSAFQQQVSGGDSGDAELVIDEVTLDARCETCDCEFEIRDFDFRCPTCRGNVRVIRGEDIQLTSVTFQNRQFAGEMAS